MGTEDKDMPNQNLEFGNRLKTFRTLNGLTQGEVAEVLNLDRSTHTYYEKGRVPNLDTLNKLSKIFNVSVAELIGERDDGALDVIKNASRELHVESIFLRPDEKQLILNLRLCSPVERQKIFDKVNQYIERKSK